MRLSTLRVQGIALLLAVMLVFGGVVAPPAQAADPYGGGAFDYPMYVMNDHTPFGFRWSAQETSTGLLPSTQYYVKVRMTVNPSPSSATNRGFTWNPDTQRWVQEREAWTQFPTVTTDADGKIASTWAYAKFGDESQSGQYYLLVSLSATGSGSTYNPGTPPHLTVLDAKTNGSWVHNGIALPSDTVNKRAAVRGPDSNGDKSNDTSDLFSLWQTEANLVDDDSNGTVDDEDWGPAGASGDVRMAAPVETTATVSTNRVLRFDDFKTAPADCDMAVGATDTVAPSRVTGLDASASGYEVELTWDAATDDGGAGLAGYQVYRWETPGLATPPYTPVPIMVGQVDAPETTFVDDTVTTGVEYGYHVRAVDADTNVGPRSDTVTVAPVAANELSREWGTDRYSTALAISKATFADGSVDTVVIATGLAFPDALGASGLAGAHGSPLLLVGSSVTSALTDEIDRLGATNVVLVGGESAISKPVHDALAATYSVKRIWGQDRYLTAAAVAREIVDLGGNDDAAYFVRGDDFADALSVSPFAYGLQTPVLLVRTNGVPAATANIVDELGFTGGWIAGGTVAVDADTADDLEALLGAKPVRLQGADRYATAVAIAQAHVTMSAANYNYVGIATGTGFADALGGGAAAGANGGVLLLTKPIELSSATKTVLQANMALIDGIHVFGGDSAVTKAVYDAIAKLLP